MHGKLSYNAAFDHVVAVMHQPVLGQAQMYREESCLLNVLKEGIRF